MVLNNSAKRSFENADVNTVICLISAPNRDQESCLQHLARFVNFTVPFEAILDAIIFYEIETAARHVLVHTRAPNSLTFPKKSLLTDGQRRTTKTKATLVTNGAGNISVLQTSIGIYSEKGKGQTGPGRKRYC